MLIGLYARLQARNVAPAPLSQQNPLFGAFFTARHLTPKEILGLRKF